MTGQTDQRFGPTSGSFAGFFGLALCAAVIGLAFEGGPSAGSLRVAIAAAGVGVLIWSYLLRPRIILDTGGGTLELRNPLSSWTIPLASVRVVGVTAVTRIETDDARYDAVAVGYPLRKLVRGSRPGAPGPTGTTGAAGAASGLDEQTVMTGAILRAADEARLRRQHTSPAERHVARVELALIGLAALVFAATYAF